MPNHRDAPLAVRPCRPQDALQRVWDPVPEEQNGTGNEGEEGEEGEERMVSGGSDAGIGAEKKAICYPEALEEVVAEEHDWGRGAGCCPSHGSLLWLDLRLELSASSISFISAIYFLQSCRFIHASSSSISIKKIAISSLQNGFRPVNGQMR